MRRAHLGLLLAGALALLTGCGDSKPPIVFDSTTLAAPTTAPSTSIPGSTSSVAVNSPVVTSSTTTPVTAGPTTEEPTTTDAAAATAVTDPPTTSSTIATEACATAGCSGPQLVPYPTLTGVPQLGDDPVQGSGCGLADPFGDSMRDGLYLGLLYPADGAVDFDVACAYYGDSAVAQGADPGASDFYVENVGTRERRVPLGPDFVYRVGSWTPDAQCVDAGPIGDADWQTAVDGTTAWLTIAGGEATSAVAFCPF